MGISSEIGTCVFIRDLYRDLRTHTLMSYLSRQFTTANQNTGLAISMSAPSHQAADVQETVGCALAVQILSNGAIPLWAGCLIVSVAAFAMLQVGSIQPHFQLPVWAANLTRILPPVRCSLTIWVVSPGWGLQGCAQMGESQSAMSVHISV